MPFSSTSGKQYIASVIDKLPIEVLTKPVLDIGAGCGTYYNLFSSKLKGPWTCVEVYEPYVHKYELHKKYHKIVTEDVRTLSFGRLYEEYGICFLGDVLEHMSVEEAQEVFDKAKANADVVIISIPLGFYPQEEYEGNPYEKHVTDDWSDAEVIAAFGTPTASAIDNEIGVYVYSKYAIKSPKIAVYAISKNEEAFVSRFCESAAGADYIIIADTGSTDATVAQARKYTEHVYNISIQPWRFDDARNASLALVPQDAEICICLDLDEVLNEGWREELLRVWQYDTTRLSYKFDWSSGVIFYSDKIHSRKGYHWKHPCHELLYPRGMREKWQKTDFMLISHYPDNTKSRGSYLDLLAIGYAEDPECTRNTFYYGRELFFKNNFKEAITVLEHFLLLNGWYIERAYAYRILGKCYEALGNNEKALESFKNAITEAPDQREPLCDISGYFQRQQKWEESLRFARAALCITSRELHYTVDPAAWSWLPFDLIALASYYLQNYQDAIANGKMALELDPGSERLSNNLNFYIEAVNKRQYYGNTKE